MFRLHLLSSLFPCSSYNILAGSPVVLEGDSVPGGDPPESLVHHKQLALSEPSALVLQVEVDDQLQLAVFVGEHEQPPVQHFLSELHFFQIGWVVFFSQVQAFLFCGAVIGKSFLAGF